MTRPLLLITSLLSLAVLAGAQQRGIVGDWREPGGSAIRIAPCGAFLCARLLQINPQAPSLLDLHNPDASKRSRHLCGLEIGTKFELTDPAHADNGFLYDPKSGKTYRGTMASDGDTLRLRGYVGFKAFGRTEEWVRLRGPQQPCS